MSGQGSQSSSSSRVEGGEQSTHQGVGRRLLLKVKRAQGRNVRIFLKRPHYAKGKERRERFETEMAEDDDERRDGQPRRKKRIWEVAREGGGARGAPSNARETWSRPGRSTKWRRRTHRPPSGSSLALAVASLGGSFLSFSRSGASPTHPPLVVVLWFPLVGPAVDKDCLALGPQSPKPYRPSWCCVLPRGSVPRFPPARVYLVAPAPRPSGLPALSLPFLLRSIIHRATEQLFTIQNPQSQISNNFLVFLAPSPGKEGGSA